MKYQLKQGKRQLVPKWPKGAHIGRLEVIDTPVHKRAYKSKVMWHYLCKCECGRVEEISQDKLNRGRRECIKCRKRFAFTKESSHWFSEHGLPEAVPRFSRLRLVSAGMLALIRRIK